jgi:hypothetical protein
MWPDHVLAFDGTSPPCHKYHNCLLHSAAVKLLMACHRQPASTRTVLLTGNFAVNLSLLWLESETKQGTVHTQGLPQLPALTAPPANRLPMPTAYSQCWVRSRCYINVQWLQLQWLAESCSAILAAHALATSDMLATATRTRVAAHAHTTLAPTHTTDCHQPGNLALMNQMLCSQGACDTHVPGEYVGEQLLIQTTPVAYDNSRSSQSADTPGPGLLVVQAALQAQCLRGSMHSTG